MHSGEVEVKQSPIKVEEVQAKGASNKLNRDETLSVSCSLPLAYYARRYPISRGRNIFPVLFLFLFYGTS